MERYFEAKDRIDALRNLLQAVESAKARIARAPDSGLAAPRPYPQLAKPGRLWLKQGRYWISYSPATPLAITGVFYETADIPHWL